MNLALYKAFKPILSWFYYFWTLPGPFWGKFNDFHGFQGYLRPFDLSKFYSKRLFCFFMALSSNFKHFLLFHVNFEAFSALSVFSSALQSVTIHYNALQCITIRYNLSKLTNFQWKSIFTSFQAILGRKTKIFPTPSASPKQKEEETRWIFSF